MREQQEREINVIRVAPKKQRGWTVKPQPHEYVFKAVWRATASLIKVPAKDYEDAISRAEKAVLRMEGGIDCMEIKFVRQTR